MYAEGAGTCVCVFMYVGLYMYESVYMYIHMCVYTPPPPPLTYTRQTEVREADHFDGCDAGFAGSVCVCTCVRACVV